MISATPIFMGIAYFLMSSFVNYRFRSLDYSLIQMWSLANGDEVQNVYHSLYGPNVIVSVLFCYIWVFFTNNAIMPLFLAISEDGFLRQAKNPRFGWLSEDFLDPVNSLVHEEEDEDMP